MPVQFPIEHAAREPSDHAAVRYAGEFGPVSYADWRATSLGSIIEHLERRLVLRLVGEVNGRDVLDVGCGDGGLALAMWQSGAGSVAGCDVDPRMIAQARAEAVRRKITIAYVLADAGHLPFRDRSFDIVSIVTVLAFVSEPLPVVQEIVRVLRPGGRVILGDLGKWSLWAASRRVRGWLRTAPMWRGAHFRSAGELCALLRAGGFRIEHLAGAVYYPRCRSIARLTAPIDPLLGQVTTFGAAFVAIGAAKA